MMSQKYFVESFRQDELNVKWRCHGSSASSSGSGIIMYDNLHECEQVVQLSRHKREYRATSIMRILVFVKELAGVVSIISWGNPALCYVAP